jgi:hypothetical protein
MYLLQIQYFPNIFISEQSNYAWTSHCPVKRTDLASVVSSPFLFLWSHIDFYLKAMLFRSDCITFRQ